MTRLVLGPDANGRWHVTNELGLGLMDCPTEAIARREAGPVVVRRTKPLQQFDGDQAVLDFEVNDPGTN